jgi:hypothetical protein
VREKTTWGKLGAAGWGYESNYLIAAHDNDHWACAMSDKGTLGHVRMEALSDGSFAFAMTLLAVDIKPPERF